MTRKIAINQPAYLPWLGYFERISRSDHYVILDHVQFEKNSMVNRNKIRTANGWQWLTVPVRTSGKFGELAITDVEIENSVKWPKKHWNSIFLNYKKAPFFNLYSDYLNECYQKKWERLCDLLLDQHDFFSQALGLNVSTVRSTEMSLKSTKSDLVLDICRDLKADAYLSGAHGRDYLDESAFRQNGIEVSYQDYAHPEYSQMHGEFISHLSVLDLLFNCGPDSLHVLQNG